MQLLQLAQVLGRPERPTWRVRRVVLAEAFSRVACYSQKTVATPGTRYYPSFRTHSQDAACVRRRSGREASAWPALMMAGPSPPTIRSSSAARLARLLSSVLVTCQRKRCTRGLSHTHAHARPPKHTELFFCLQKSQKKVGTPVCGRCRTPAPA